MGRKRRRERGVEEKRDVGRQGLSLYTDPSPKEAARTNKHPLHSSYILDKKELGNATSFQKHPPLSRFRNNPPNSHFISPPPALSITPARRRTHPSTPWPPIGWNGDLSERA